MLLGAHWLTFRLLHCMGQFIGEADHLNEGVGNCNYIVPRNDRHEIQAAKVITDTQSENQRAIKCYARMNFCTMT